MQLNCEKCVKSLASSCRRGLKRIASSIRVALIFSIIFFSTQRSHEERVTADSMECYALPQRRLRRSMKLVQLVFVLNNINLNSLLLMWKKTQNKTDWEHFSLWATQQIMAVLVELWLSQIELGLQFSVLSRGKQVASSSQGVKWWWTIWKSAPQGASASQRQLGIAGLPRFKFITRSAVVYFVWEWILFLTIHHILAQNVHFLYLHCFYIICKHQQLLIRDYPQTPVSTDRHFPLEWQRTVLACLFFSGWTLFM